MRRLRNFPQNLTPAKLAAPWIQAVDATDSGGWDSSRWRASAGVWKSRRLRGVGIGAAGCWTLLCLSSGVGEAVERGGWAGGGLDAAVEPSGEGAFEAAADVSMRFALGGAFGFVGPGFVVAAESGNRDRVQGAVEVPVAGTAETVSGPLAAAGLQRSDASQ